MDDSTDGIARAARPTSSAMGGKQTCPLKTLVTDDVGEDFARFARDRGYGTTSDALRELVIVAVYGPEYLANLHRKRIDSLVSNRPGIGTDGG